MATKAPEAPTREQLIAALGLLNADAKAIRCKTSPAADEAHAELDRLLDEIVGA